MKPKQPPKFPEHQPPGTTPYLLGSLLVSGAACLVIEIAGARLISPFYGSSIYTWSATITITMVSLALGYWWGGRLADRYPHLTQFARLLTAAGITVAAVPWLRVPVLKATLPLGVQLGAFASSGALLGPTLILLSALGPLAVRLTATGAGDSGRRSGDAWAVSTAGSVIGAILAGFVLIPNVPLSRIILGAALALLLLGAIGSWLSQRAVPVAQLAACAACVGLALQPQAKPKYAAYAKESAYGRIAVLDNGARRYLLVNGTSQSIMENDGGESESQYVRALEWTRALRPKAKEVLVVGLGAGLLPKALERRGLIADSVEIDPAIADAAAKYFGYQPKGGLFVGDGRAAVELAQKKWDIAFLDAFGAESPPTHLFTREYFSSVREKLVRDGVFAINIVSSVDGRDDRPWKAVYRTLKSVFPNVRAFVGNDPNEGLANVLIFSSDGPLQAGPPAAPERTKKEVELMLSRELALSPEELAKAVLLTDDYAPLDSLMAGTSRRWRGLLQKAMPELLLD